MKAQSLFVDSFYWIALIDPNDPWRDRVLTIQPTLGSRQLHTSEDCLGEVLTFFSAKGSYARAGAAQLVNAVRANKAMIVHGRSGRDFSATITFYESRPDKGYSFVDCLSMILMRKHGIRSVLTGDRHFAQEGFDLAL